MSSTEVVAKEEGLWGYLKSALSEQIPYLHTLKVERVFLNDGDFPDSEYLSGKKPLITYVTFSGARQDAPETETTTGFQRVGSKLSAKTVCHSIALERLVGRGEMFVGEDGRQYQKLDFTALLERLKRDLGDFWERSGIYYDPLGRGSDHSFKLFGRQPTWPARVFECLTHDEKIAVNPDVREHLSELVGRNLTWMFENPGGLIFAVEWPIAAIDRWRVFKKDGRECLRIYLDKDRLYTEGSLFRCDLRLRVHLMERDKVVFFTDEIENKNLFLDKERRPYVEIDPVESHEISAARIELFFNEYQIDESEAYVLRQIKVNVQIGKINP